jgi:serine protease
VDAAPFDDTSVLAWYAADDTVSSRAPPSLTVTGDWLEADSPGIAWDPLAERVSGDALRLQIDQAHVPSGVRVSLFPGDTVLGEFLVDQEGSLDETVSLPGDLAPEIYVVQVALVETVIDSVPTTWRVEAPVRVIDPPPSPSPSPEPSDIASPSPEPSAEVSEPAAPVLCPAAATDVGVTAAMNSAQVSWAWSDEVLGDGDVSFYVEAASDLLDVGPRVVRAPGDTRSVTVDGLRNGVDYTFTVYAATDSGSGPASAPASGRPTTGVEGEVAGVIVTYSSTVQAPSPEGSVPGADAIDAVGLVAGEEVSEGSHVVEFTEAVDISTAQEIAAELTRQPEIIYAEPDLFLFTAEDTDLQEPAVESSEPPLATPVAVPDDPEYSSDQWNLWDTYGISIGDGADAMTDAWAGPRGEGVTVAVIDTGITDHPDLDGQVVDGYDFVSSPEQLASTRTLNGDAVALDGDYVDEATYGSVGRDGNPADPGDWRMVAPTRHSSWHGTKVAGIIAASAGNGEGIAGVAPRASIQPVRALSWRGGLLSDIAASITWASGGSIDGVPANATPSKVINLSFAVEAMCPVALQAAIDGARERGSILVAAAGNAADDAANYAPGNCDGVITVAATTSAGTRAAYSNYGPVIDLAAPGGDSAQPVPTSSNTGTTAPEAPGASTSFGTSIAAAHVSAGAALLAATDPALTPDDAYRTLTGRDYVKDFANPTCDSNPQYSCGTGILSLAQIASVASSDDDFAMTLASASSQHAVSTSTSMTSSMSGAFAVEAWVRPASCIAAENAVVSVEFSFLLTCTSSNTWRYALGQGSSWSGYRDVSTGVPAGLNAWQHVAITRSS